MIKTTQLMFRKVTTIGYIFAIVSALTAGALGHPKEMVSNKDDHDHDHRFDHRHHYFSFPYWWYDAYGYEYGYDSQYWHELAIKVQLELARLGFYHGPISGVIDQGCHQAIRAFQRAHGLSETGLIDPGLLRSLKLPVPQPSSQIG